MENIEFRSKRITRAYRQIINAIPEKVFPLLCPVREAEWLDGWQYNMIYSESGLVEEGAVFSTPYEGEEDTIWIVTKHDSSTREVEFARFTNHSRTCLLKIAVKPKDGHSSYVEVSYTYTGISPAGNDFVDDFTEDIFLEAVTFWEKSMNYFLETGERIKKASTSKKISHLGLRTGRLRNRRSNESSKRLPIYSKSKRFWDGNRHKFQSPVF